MGCVSSVHFQALVMKKLSYKDYNKRITTHDNGNNQSHDQKKSKLNSTSSTNSGAHTLTHYVPLNRCNDADAMFLFKDVELVVIFFTFNTRRDYVIPSDFGYNMLMKIC